MKQNKKIFLAAAALCLSLGAAAQQERKAVVAGGCETCGGGDKAGITVFSYIAAAQRHYVVYGSVPGSDVELYSAPSGGEIVAVVTADEKGEARFSISPETAVAFAINHNRVNDKGIAGNGHVTVLPPAAISLDNFEVNTVSYDAVLNWRAATLAGDWVFVVQKSNDNINFTDVASVDARGGDGVQGYSYSCKKAEDIAVQYFRVEARERSGVKVTSDSKISKSSTKSFFTVQPSLFENSLQLTIARDKLPAGYVVTDAMGRTKYASGVVNNVRQSINLAVLSGTYILRVTDRKGVSSSQMVIRK
jgi:hypothetical protein